MTPEARTVIEWVEVAGGSAGWIWVASDGSWYLSTTDGDTHRMVQVVCEDPCTEE